MPFLRKERTARQTHATTMASTTAVARFMASPPFFARREPLRPGAIRRYSMPYAAWGCTAGATFFAEKSGMGRSNWNKIATSTTTATAVPGVNPPPAKNVPN